MLLQLRGPCLLESRCSDISKGEKTLSFLKCILCKNLYPKSCTPCAFSIFLSTCFIQGSLSLRNLLAIAQFYPRRLYFGTYSPGILQKESVFVLFCFKLGCDLYQRVFEAPSTKYCCLSSQGCFKNCIICLRVKYLTF